MYDVRTRQRLYVNYVNNSYTRIYNTYCLKPLLSLSSITLNQFDKCVLWNYFC